MPNNTCNIVNNNVTHEGDFSLFFNTSTKIQGGNPLLENKSLTKVIEIKEILNLCDYGELGTLNRRALLFAKTTFLVVFKEDWTTF